LGIKPGQKEGTGRWTMENMFDMFSNLKERADVEASVMSGGEQQMLTMCRTLMGDPDLVMIDEPTEGLSPQMVTRVADVLQEIARRGVSTLLVEQKLSIAMDIAHRVYVMGHGKVVFEGTPDELRGREDVRKEWLEV
jgi:branched-chain amino acid transport system ATP-binding protein